jgi:hypothetical protein
VRRRVATSAFLSTLLALALPASAETGGPGRGGYTFVDNRGSEGSLPYQWLEVPEEEREPLIFSLGTGDALLPWALVELGIDFDYYGESVTSAFVHPNAAISFVPFPTTMEMAYGFYPFGSVEPPNGLICLYCALLSYVDEEVASPEYYSATLDTEHEGRVFVVTYENIEMIRSVNTSAPLEPGPISVQGVLFEDTDEVLINVRESGRLQGGHGFPFHEPAIGVESPDGASGIGVNGGAGAFPDGYAIRFTPGPALVLSPNVMDRVVETDEESELHLTLHNRTGTEQTASIAVDAPEGWNVSTSHDELTLEVDAETTFSVTVAAAAPLTEGASGDIRITAEGGDFLSTATVRLRTRLEHGSWEPIASLPMALSSIALVADDEALYSLGGLFEAGDSYEARRETWRWDAEEDLWDVDAIANLPAPVYGGAACLLDDTIYYVGGITDANIETSNRWDFAYADGLFVYDFETDAWSVGEPPPALLTSSAVVCDSERGLVYSVGGYFDLDGNGRNVGEGMTIDPRGDLVLIYDPTGESWSFGPPLPLGLSSSSAEILDDELIISTGLIEFGLHLRETFVLNMASDEWRREAFMPSPARLKSGSAVFRGRLCYLGGVQATSGEAVLFDIWECLDEGVWVRQEIPMSIARYGAGAAELDDQIYVVGGIDEDGIVAAAERYPATLPSDGGVDADMDAGPDAEMEGDAGAPSSRDGCSCAATGSSFLSHSLLSRLLRSAS